MAYQRFKIPEMSSTPATLATVATLPPDNSQSVATVANVADPEPENVPQTVASVATVASPELETEILDIPFPDLPGKSDAELYADALRQIGPCGYGGVGSFLGWGMSRASEVESELRLAGKIAYDRFGRGTLLEG